MREGIEVLFASPMDDLEIHLMSYLDQLLLKSIESTGYLLEHSSSKTSSNERSFQKRVSLAQCSNG